MIITHSGALPRQLVLECLDSVQKILFPLTDRKSKSLLLSLTSTSSFDPDGLRFDSVSIRNNNEKDIAYHYFGGHLADLYDELENPTPRGWVCIPSERFVMFQTRSRVPSRVLGANGSWKPLRAVLSPVILVEKETMK